MFFIFHKFSIIFKPIIINIWAVLIIVVFGKMFDLIIEDFTLSMKVISFPLTLIGYFSIGIVKGSKAVHFIIKPMTMIFTSIDVEECAQSVSFVIFYFAHVLGAWGVWYAPNFDLLYKGVVNVFPLGVVVSGFFSIQTIILLDENLAFVFI